MNSTAIFDLALGLSSPWYVSKVEFLDSLEGTKEYGMIDEILTKTEKYVF